MNYKVFFKKKRQADESEVEKLNSLLGEEFSEANVMDALRTLGEEPTLCHVKDKESAFETGLFFTKKYNIFYLR